jgi:hypothetical protein
MSIFLSSLKSAYFTFSPLTWAIRDGRNPDVPSTWASSVDRYAGVPSTWAQSVVRNTGDHFSRTSSIGRYTDVLLLLTALLINSVLFLTLLLKKIRDQFNRSG